MAGSYSRFEGRVRCRFDAMTMDVSITSIMGEFAIGQSVLRREDPRLLQRGRAKAKRSVNQRRAGALTR